MLAQMNFPLNIVFPNGSEFQAMNPASAEQLLKMASCFTEPASFASTVTPRTNPTLTAPVPHLEPITIKVFTEEDDTDCFDQIVDVVKTWATRSRSGGNRGNRIAVLSAIDVLPSANGVVLEINLLVGTDVWYNERRMTIGFPATKSEWEENIQNIFEHMDFGFDTEVVRIESETHGVIFDSEGDGQCNGCDGCSCGEIEEDEQKDIAVALVDIIGDLTCSEIENREDILVALESAKEKIESLIEAVRGE